MSDAVRSAAMTRVKIAFEEVQAPGSCISLEKGEARDNVPSTFVLKIAHDIRETIEPFRQVWDDRYSQAPSNPPQSIKPQVHQYLVNVFNQIPVTQRTGILLIVEGLDYCDDQILDQIFECFETCVRNLPMCFLISSAPQRSIQERLQQLSLAGRAGPINDDWNL
jgi:hypothetical protein